MVAKVEWWLWPVIVVVVVVVVVGVVVAVAMIVADSIGGCGRCCGFFFLGSRIYYFIVEDILFKCRGYIILL